MMMDKKLEDIAIVDQESVVNDYRNKINSLKVELDHQN